MTDHKALEALNRAFAADPGAMHALICNHVPCNQALADDATVVVDSSLVHGASGWTIGALGLINGILGEMGLPLVASKFSDTPDADGKHSFYGFCLYTPGKETPSAEALDVLRMARERMQA